MDCRVLPASGPSAPSAFVKIKDVRGCLRSMLLPRRIIYCCAWWVICSKRARPADLLRSFATKYGHSRSPLQVGRALFRFGSLTPY